MQQDFVIQVDSIIIISATRTHEIAKYIKIIGRYVLD